MTNDNRTQILAHQTIEDANNSSYQRQQIEQHREMILAQEQNIRRLKAEIADMTMQRDAWFKMASTYALEQAPERLKTVELTAEQAAVLVYLDKHSHSTFASIEKYTDVINLDSILDRFNVLGYVITGWHSAGITDKGRAALAAHKARNESEGE